MSPTNSPNPKATKDMAYSKTKGFLETWQGFQSSTPREEMTRVPARWRDAVSGVGLRSRGIV